MTAEYLATMLPLDLLVPEVENRDVEKSCSASHLDTNKSGSVLTLLAVVLGSPRFIETLLRQSDE